MRARKWRGLLWAVGISAALACRAQPDPQSTHPPAPEAAAPRQQAEPAKVPQNAPPAPAPLASPLPSLADLVDAVKGSVINVEVRQKAEAPGIGGSPLEDFFGSPSPFGPGLPPGLPPGHPPGGDGLREGIGSGFIISADGLALTNNHVVEGAVGIDVTLDDGRQFSARVVGRDPLTDVALLRLEGKVEDLPVARLGDSDKLRVGDWVVAIGEPFGLASTVSAGILSARAREIGVGPYDDFLQTDAAINPGNSGGPLFNLRGEVVGINTAIVGGGAGIGFAVPSNLVTALLPQLQAEGVVRRGWLGVSVQDLTPPIAEALDAPVSGGAIVLGVNKGTPAASAGLREDDIIVTVNGEALESARELTRRVGAKRPGEQLTLELYRGEERLSRRVKLGTRPDLEGHAARPTPEPEESTDKAQQLGMVVRDLDPRMMPQPGGPTRGALIVSISPGSPAERAELSPGMVVVEAAGKAIRNAEELRRVLTAQKPGETVLLRVHLGEARFLRGLRMPAAP